MRLSIKFVLTYSVFCLSFSATYAQITWEKLFSARQSDVFRSVKQVDSGSYVIAGYTADSTANDTDAVVVKVNISGDTVWTFKYNGPNSGKDLFYKVLPTADGGFALCGYTTSITSFSDDVMYMKLNSAGQMQWVKFWGGSGRDRAQDIVELPNGNFAIVGYTTSAPALYYDAFLIVTASNGDTLWTRRYGGSSYDDANTVQVLSDGGFIMGGQSNNGANGFDQYLIRTNSSGDTLWTRKMGGPYTDNIESLILVSGGYVLAGSTNSPSRGDDGYLVKTDTSGSVVWSKSFGGSFPDDFHSLQQTTDGGFVACGTTTSTGPLLPNLWVMKTSASGDSLWSKALGGDSHDHGYCAIQTLDGGYLIVGHTGSYGFNHEEAIVIKTDASGVVNNKLIYTAAYLLIEPTSTTCGNSNTIVKVLIRNFGDTSVAGVPVSVQISGALNTTINQTYSGTFYAGDADTVTFSTPINTTGGGTYTFYCFTNNNNDVYPLRNSFTTTLTIEGYGSNPVVTPSSRCGSGTVTLSATASTTLYWFSASSGGTPLSTGASFTTPSIAANTTYYVQSGLNCPSARMPAVATINTIPAAPVGTEASRCGPGSVVLSAIAPNTISWYNVPTGGSSLSTGSTFTTPSVSTTTTFYAEANNANCPSARVPVQAIIDLIPASPVGTAAQRCGTGSLVLNAASPDAVSWYDAPTAGNLLASGNTFTTPVISSTTIYYAEANNGKCTSSRTPVSATITTSGVDPVINSTSHCGPGSVTLNAISQDSVIWYDASSGGNVLWNGNNFTTPVLNSTTTFYAQSGNGSCLSNMVSVTVTINPAATDPVTISGQNCGPGLISLSANSPDPILWYDAPVGGNQLGLGANFTTPFLSNTTTYYAVSFKGVCFSNRISAIAEVLPVPSVNLGPDTAINGNSFTLDAGAGMTSYHWSTGETTQSITVNSTNTYCVVITSTENCTSTDCIFVDLITAVKNPVTGEQIIIYPNPSLGNITVSLPDNFSESVLTIYNSVGEIVFVKETGKSVSTLDLQHLTSGIYFLKINSGRFSELRKIVLE